MFLMTSMWWICFRLKRVIVAAFKHNPAYWDNRHFKTQQKQVFDRTCEHQFLETRPPELIFVKHPWAFFFICFTEHNLKEPWFHLFFRGVIVCSDCVLVEWNVSVWSVAWWTLWSCGKLWTLEVIDVGAGFTAHCESHTDYTPSREMRTTHKKQSKRK